MNARGIRDFFSHFSYEYFAQTYVARHLWVQVGVRDDKGSEFNNKHCKIILSSFHLNVTNDIQTYTGCK
jgi:hypothetical protein